MPQLTTLYNGLNSGEYYSLQGGVISNNYFGNIRDFKILKVKEGSGPALVFINGFLEQKNQNSKDWLDAVKDCYPTNPCYYVTWESKTLYDLGSLFTKDATGKAISSIAKNFAKRASRKAASKINPLTWTTIVADLISNPWHVAMVKAQTTGVLLADLLSRCKNTEFILMGHSLGCRVIYYLLESLSSKSDKCVKDVYLLGGAVDRNDEKGWKEAIKAVKGKIYNCYTGNDKILKYLYKPANALISDPIGLDVIKYNNRKIDNWDVSEIVSGHMKYKDNFGEILKQIQNDPFGQSMWHNFFIWAKITCYWRWLRQKMGKVWKAPF